MPSFNYSRAHSQVFLNATTGTTVATQESTIPTTAPRTVEAFGLDTRTLLKADTSTLSLWPATVSLRSGEILRLELYFTFGTSDNTNAKRIMTLGDGTNTLEIYNGPCVTEWDSNSTLTLTKVGAADNDITVEVTWTVEKNS